MFEWHPTRSEPSLREQIEEEIFNIRPERFEGIMPDEDRKWGKGAVNAKLGFRFGRGSPDSWEAWRMKPEVYRHQPKEREIYKCEQCRSLFHPHPTSDAKRFCSRSCMEEFYEASLKSTCPQCGEGFLKAETKQECCSVACAMKLRSKRQADRKVVRTAACECCKKPFVLKNRPSRPDQRFCSRKCSCQKSCSLDTSPVGSTPT
jgi:hypothetical protein